MSLNGKNTQAMERFLAVLDPRVASVVAVGLDRARRRPNNMARVAAALPLPRQALFHVTYALMRAIDDFVDEDFLARPPAERARGRTAMLATVDRWQAQAEAAAAGRYVARSEALMPALFAVMNRVVGASEIGPAPWRALAGAMRADIAEAPLADWTDFRAYGEGAAVAPASVFVYILAADVADDLASTLSLDRPPADYARDLALFCYLVHVLRDLSVDAHRAARLVTLPDDVLADTGLDKPVLARAVSGDRTVDLTPLVRAVAEEAGRYRRAAIGVVAELAVRLDPVERIVIETLYALYNAQFAAIVANPSGVADGSVALDEARLAGLLAPLGRLA